MKKRIIIVSDHAGFELKEFIVSSLSDEHIIKDLGCYTKERVDYPDYAKKLCEYMSSSIEKKEDDILGVVICGTGIGMSIACNRFPFIRCGLCHDLFTAEMTRKHNDANVLALGARVLEKEVAIDIINKFISTDFEGGRHADRIAKI